MSVVSEKLENGAGKFVLTSNQLSSAVACILPGLAHDRKAFDTQIDLLLGFRAVWSSAKLSTMLPKRCGG